MVFKMKEKAGQTAFSVRTTEKMLLHPLTLAFRNSHAHMEKPFLEEYFVSSLPLIRFSFFFAILLFAVFGILDAYLIPEQKHLFWLLRYAIFCPLTFGLFLLSFSKYFKKIMQPAMAFVVVVAGACIITMTVLASPPASYSYYTGVILVFMMGYTVIKLRFIWATAAGWFLVFLYEFAGFFFTETPVTVLVNNNFFFISANLIGMVACYAIEYNTRRDFFLKTLLDIEREHVSQARDNLETMVQKRTSQLTKVNTSLQKEMNERKRLQSQLVRHQKMEAIGLMAGGVAHDLNNILSGITGYPELLLLQLPEDSELRKPIEAIQDSGERAAAVVADLLTVARGAASTRVIANLNSLVTEYLDSPECRNLQTLHPNILCHKIVEDDLPNISCSPIHIKKCIMNLITNAAEAMDQSGNITVETTSFLPDLQWAEEHGMEVMTYVTLTVRDTGAGISEKDLEHIFEPFYTKKEMGRSGTGLGLAVVWNTMEDHAGKVFVKSSKQGTRFQLYFPANNDTPPSPLNHRQPEEVMGNKEHILVVDDESTLRDLAGKMLENLGYEVDSVSSGELAVRFLKDTPVDLVMLDMLMDPGMNGRQTYTEILKLHPTQKAIIVSGFSESEDVKATLKLGAGGFIKKPYSISELGQAVKGVL